jgi:hypothetical protein
MIKIKENRQKKPKEEPLKNKEEWKSKRKKDKEDKEKTN